MFPGRMKTPESILFLFILILIPILSSSAAGIHTVYMRQTSELMHCAYAGCVYAEAHFRTYLL